MKLNILSVVVVVILLCILWALKYYIKPANIPSLSLGGSDTPSKQNVLPLATEHFMPIADAYRSSDDHTWWWQKYPWWYRRWPQAQTALTYYYPDYFYYPSVIDPRLVVDPRRLVVDPYYY
jgi:hypothetical protein